MAEHTDILSSRRILLDGFAGALQAAAPGPAVTRALRHVAVERPVWVVAVGKAAPAMARAAAAHLHADALAGGLVVSQAACAEPAPGIEVVCGEHPVPGHGSLLASSALERLAERVPPGDDVWVFLSGGATSLLAAPGPGLFPADLRPLFQALHAAGLPIDRMNAVRARLLRWGAGRLAAELASARIRQFILSDVPGTELTAVGSGPCLPPAVTAAEAEGVLRLPAVAQHLPADLLGRAVTALYAAEGLARGRAGQSADPVVVADNSTALAGAASRLARLGLATDIRTEPLVGEARTSGHAFARELLIRRASAGNPLVFVAGGECTVTLTGAARRLAPGGRCQEFALAAAETLHAEGADDSIAVLAAGTDGRDGPTDAAGAVVTGSTWTRIAAAGLDPAALLDAHRSYAALDAADALLRTGTTGTNVMDVMLGMVG